MRKIICLGLVFLLLMSVSACGVSNSSTAATTKNTTVNVKEDDAGEEAAWKTFLKEYEQWVDDYVDIMKKYNDNPTDLSILADYSKMISDLADWSKRVDEVQNSIVNAEDVLEYSQEIFRIAEKLAEIA